MKVLPLILIAAALGTGLGVAMAYVTVGPLEGDQLAKPAPASVDPAQAPREGPRVRIDSVVHNFGVMQRGAKRTHEFVVSNDGLEPLTLKTGATSCKCTEFVAGSGLVPPGGKTLVKLEWVAKSMPGEFRQTARLVTNDPTKTEIELSVEGEVVEATGIQPSEFRLGRVAATEEGEAMVVVMGYDEEELVVTAEPPVREDGVDVFRFEVTPLPVEELPDSRAKSGARVTLIAGPGLPVGVITDWATLHTNLPAAETLQVPVIGRVEGDVTIHGAGWSADTGVLALGFVDGAVGKQTKLRVSIKGPEASQAELRVKEATPPELLVGLGEPRRVRDEVVHVPLSVEVPAGTRPMIHLNTGRKPDGTYTHPEGRILLSTSLPSTPEVELRVRFAVQDKGR